MEKLNLYVLDEEEDNNDEIYWTLENSGKFFVSSAYHSITNGDLNVQDKGWEKIWKIKVPNRVRMFLWLARHERIMCNAERRRRHITDNDCCSTCLNVSETTEHVLRKCPKVMDIWKQMMSDREM